MIITRTPLRTSFVGGGSDLPSFYRKTKGAVISTTIDKYVYVSAHPYFHGDRYLLKYSKTEEVETPSDIKNPIIRNSVIKSNMESGIEISSSADVPAGTGLGSSSTFTVGILNCLNYYKDKLLSPIDLAKQACEIEIEELGEPIGKQDQYAAAFGGLNLIEFHPDETVTVEPLSINEKTKKSLENNLLMFYVGGSRSASSILKSQKKAMENKNKFRIQKKMVKLVYALKEALLSSNLKYFGELLDSNWLLKKELVGEISNNRIDSVYEIAKKNGALGGKLLGAGGTGFLLFYCEPENKKGLINSLSEYRHLPFKFSNSGSVVIHAD